MVLTHRTHSLIDCRSTAGASCGMLLVLVALLLSSTSDYCHAFSAGLPHQPAWYSHDPMLEHAVTLVQEAQEAWQDKNNNSATTAMALLQEGVSIGRKRVFAMNNDKNYTREAQIWLIESTLQSAQWHMAQQDWVGARRDAWAAQTYCTSSSTSIDDEESLHWLALTCLWKVCLAQSDWFGELTTLKAMQEYYLDHPSMSATADDEFSAAVVFETPAMDKLQARLEIVQTHLKSVVADSSQAKNTTSVN